MTTQTVAIINAVADVIAAVRKNHEGIPEVVVTLASAKGKHGHFAPSAWSVRNDEEGAKPVYQHEMFLAAESLKRGAVGTVGTIIHELVHAYCHANDIQDTSNGGTYHNKRFAGVAEEFGIAVEKMGHHGFSRTTVPDATVRKYQREVDALEAALTVYRNDVGLAASVTKSTAYFMVCGTCNDRVRLGSKKWFERNLPVCSCGEPFDLVQE